MLDIDQYRDESGAIDLQRLIFEEPVFGFQLLDTSEQEKEIAGNTVRLINSNVNVTSRQLAVVVGCFTAIVGALNTRIQQLEDAAAEAEAEETLESLLAAIRDANPDLEVEGQVVRIPG